MYNFICGLTSILSTYEGMIKLLLLLHIRVVLCGQHYNYIWCKRSSDICFNCFITAPFPPTNLTVNYPGEPRNSTTLLVTWDRPLCDRGILSGYELCYVESSIGDCVSNGMRVNMTGPDELSYTINDLSINTNYTVELRGRTGAGLGDPATATNSTDEDGKLYSPCPAVYLAYVVKCFMCVTLQHQILLWT